jgi:hypothetical protein
LNDAAVYGLFYLCIFIDGVSRGRLTFCLLAIVKTKILHHHGTVVPIFAEKENGLDCAALNTALSVTRDVLPVFNVLFSRDSVTDRPSRYPCSHRTKISVPEACKHVPQWADISMRVLIRRQRFWVCPRRTELIGRRRKSTRVVEMNTARIGMSLGEVRDWEYV